MSAPTHTQHTPDAASRCDQCRFLAGVATVEEATTLDDLTPWLDSPFLFLKKVNSRTRGKAGEGIAAEWLRSKGFQVSPATGSGHDRVVNTHNVEIKTSTLWENGAYTFSQIRDQDYKAGLLLGISPHRAHIWVVPKATLLLHARSQHGGESSMDTSWIKFPADNPPKWIRSYGGSLSAATRSARKLLP